MSSIARHLKSIIAEILIEVGEGTSKTYFYKKRNEFQYTFVAKLGNNMSEEVTVDFEDANDNPEFTQRLVTNRFPAVKTIYNVGYKVGDTEFQFVRSDLKVLLRIISTVLAIVIEFIHENEPDMLFIKGSNKTSDPTDKGERQKTNLYKAFLWKQLEKIPDYNAEDRLGGFIVYKNNN